MAKRSRSTRAVTDLVKSPGWESDRRLPAVVLAAVPLAECLEVIRAVADEGGIQDGVGSLRHESPLIGVLREWLPDLTGPLVTHDVKCE